MTTLLIGIPTFCYALAALVHAGKSEWQWVFVYGGYAVANIGLLWASK